MPALPGNGTVPALGPGPRAGFWHLGRHHRGRTAGAAARTGAALTGQSRLGCAQGSSELTAAVMQRRKGIVMVGAKGSDARAVVAVIGAGIMGSAMTRNLVVAGVNTRVWDRSPAATAPLEAAGAVVAASAREAVRDADVVITMLPTADVVESVILAGG